MQEPVRPYPPYKGEYDAKVERRYIYSYKETLQEDCYEEEFDDDDEEEAKGHPVQTNSRSKWPTVDKDDKVPAWGDKEVEKVDLAWLLTQIPAGVTPNQIKIEFGYNASSMSYDDYYLRFYYEEKVPARTKEYNAAVKQHKLDFAKYKADCVAYEAFKKEQEIKETEEKLARLKKGI